MLSEACFSGFKNGLNFGFENIKLILEILERLKNDSAW